jgi:hypothetical protein
MVYRARYRGRAQSRLVRRNWLGSSFSAEHGIGIDQRETLTHYTSPEKVKIMKNIKKFLDPKGVINPGGIFQAPMNRDDLLRSTLQLELQSGTLCQK